MSLDLSNPEGFLPHGYCLLWRPGLLALHVVSDAVIAAAYFAIPISLAVFLQNRRDLSVRHRALAGLFAVFICLCGLTHVLNILVLWRPEYELEGLVKAATAIASLGTAAILPLLIPEALRIPSPRALEAEIASHKDTMRALEAARLELAGQVVRTEQDLEETTRRFETAIANSTICLSEQDEHLVYTWAFNPPLGVEPNEVIGHRDADLFSADTAPGLTAVKALALSENRPQRVEIRAERQGRTAWLDLRAEPITSRTGDRGVVVVAADITELKEKEERLGVLTRELNHRSKNLLTIVLSVTRQTTRSLSAPRELSERLEERLISLAAAHDVLARAEWRGADLKDILRSQLQHQIDAYPGRITFAGPPVEIPPEGAHYVAMALHELGANAIKYGALSTAAGSVRIDWVRSEGPEGPRLVLEWIERGGPETRAPESRGFGSTILARLTPAALRGAAELTFRPEGVTWRLDAPVP